MPPKLRTKLSTSTEPDVSQKAGEVATMATVRELLKAQENMFKALFEASMNAVNKRIDSLITAVSDLKASFGVYSKRCPGIKACRQVYWIKVYMHVEY